MTQVEFEHEMDRLSKTWPNSFGKERARLIWVRTQNMTYQWFNKLVSDLICNNKAAPLPVDFIQAVSDFEKKQFFKTQQIEFNPNKESIFNPEERSEIFRTMRLTALGKLSRKDALQFSQAIDSALKAKGISSLPWQEQNQNGDWIS